MNLKCLNTAAVLIILFLSVYILYIGKYLFLPLILALIFWYIIVGLTKVYQRIPLGRRHLPYGIALVISIISSGIVLYLFFVLLTYSISNIIAEAPKYQLKLEELLAYLDKLIAGRLDLHRLISQINLTDLFSKIALIASSIASNFAVILVYLFFLLLEYRTFGTKLKTMCNSHERYIKVSAFFNKIHRDVNGYLKIKTAINIIGALAVYIVLRGFGIYYAEFWAMLFFILHYIPYLGPVVGIFLVLLAASIQITHLGSFIILGLLLMLIAVGIGNFLEPHWLGTRLNLSPMVILISLAFWATIWGVLGMILCIPIMVITNIILAKFPKTRPIAVMLSADGKVETD